MSSEEEKVSNEENAKGEEKEAISSNNNTPDLKLDEKIEKSAQSNSNFDFGSDKVLSNLKLKVDDVLKEESKKEKPKGEPINFKVVYNKTKYDIEFPIEGTVKQLKEHLAPIINVLPTMQKVMIKGLAKDDKTLQELGVTKGAKLMVVGSKLNDVVNVNVPKVEVISVGLAHESDTEKFSFVKILEEASKCDGALLCDKYGFSNKFVGDNMEDLRSDAERLAEISDVLANKKKDIERAERAVIDAKNIAEMYLKLADEIEENIRKLGAKDTFRYEMLREFHITAERLAEISEDILSDVLANKKKDIGRANRAVDNAKNIAEMDRKYASRFK